MCYSLCKIFIFIYNINIQCIHANILNLYMHVCVFIKLDAVHTYIMQTNLSWEVINRN